MKAILLNEPGGTEKLIFAHLPMPEISGNEVLVQVKAISINPVDAKSRAGKGVFGRLKDQLPLVLGWDISGVVIQKGVDSAFNIGDEVFGMVNFPGHGRGYAEFVAAPADQLVLKPTSITHPQAAAATLAALTAYQALVHKAKITPEQNVLIHAAAGGVGHYAIQIAKHLGARVTGTSSNKNRDLVLNLGADHHIDYQGYNWAASGKEFDFVLDTIGGDSIDNSLEVTKPGGTLISIPSGLNESVAEKAKEKGVNGYFFLVASSGDDMQVLAEWLDKGIIRSHVSQIFTFEDMARAHQQIESGRTVGKIIVEL